MYNLRGLRCLVVGAPSQSAHLITLSDSLEITQLGSELSISLIAVLVIEEKKETQIISG